MTNDQLECAKEKSGEKIYVFKKLQVLDFFFSIENSKISYVKDNVDIFFYCLLPDKKKHKL